MKSPPQTINWKEAVAELVAMMFFVYVGCGSAATQAGNDAWILGVSLQFGLAITTLAYATAHISGGQINCAVTFALVIAKQKSVAQGLVNLVSQLLGSVLGAALLLAATVGGQDRTTALGSNTLAPDYTVGNAFVSEMLMTALLVYVVFETAVNKRSVAGNNAPIAIGFAVFLAHMVNIPITGCSINPTRSFGPAVVASLNGAEGLWQHHWIFWVAPLTGAGIVALLRGRIISAENSATDLNETKDEELSL
eukprot:CAMPEP_0194295648 /NCGR_PEP_ID=MMETSP0169-20130528/54023_1 /TAXON_ID=218684 /ORGANISM="Corethron pennatum, Strain L29A3" /LENGTH=250 /DNA_ID=CAMNT_0039044869 /DNA_START=97 /DNA_END=849 /DNA_ORIENTATION=-